MTDRLAWWEEIPLGLALLAQSYVVGLWYFASIKGAGQWADLAIAIGAGLALDLVVITTVMGRRMGRSSGWSWATSLGAFLCSSLIALDRYGWEWRSGLHIAFPLVVFLYSQHLAEPKRSPISAQATPARTPLENLPERLELTKAPDHVMEVAPLESANEQAILSTPFAPVTVLHAHRYTCPHCSQALKNKQAVGAAVKNGYCLACKQSRLRSA